MNINVQLKKLDKDGIIPTNAHKGDAGYDLYSLEEYELKLLERKLFKTGISLAIPEGFYGRIAPRSGLAVKKGIDVLAGVVDSIYRGEICVVLINLGNENVKINKGERIAQIIFEQYHEAEIKVVEELSETLRNEKGFGSTGANSNYIDPNSINPIPPKSVLMALYNKTHIEETPKKLYSELMKEQNRQ
jgi:dUTP pyrophosphatase